MKRLNKYYLLFFVSIIALSSCTPTVAKFMKEASATEAPTKITFKNNSENAETYAWDFGDGNISEEKDPVHTYIKPGSYTITLTVRKGKKLATASQVVEVGGTERCLVELTTEFGVMVLELSDETPQHRDNFLKHVEDGYYNDLLFHRVISGFMIQGGDPNSRNAKPNTRIGTGGPGYQVPAEFNPNLVHVKGALAAARQPDSVNPEKKSSGSQFYIVHGGPVTESTLRRQEAKMDEYYSPAVKAEYLEKGGFPLLDGGYTVFGKVVSGLEVIDKIANVTTDGDPPQGASRPKSDVKMTMKVIE